MSVYAVTNPATGEQVKTFPTFTDDELDSAIALAYDTYQNWLRSSTVEERAKLVRRVGELHSERREQLAEITTREMGKPLEQALGEVDFCVDIYGFYADNGPDLMRISRSSCSPVRGLRHLPQPVRRDPRIMP